MRRTTLLILVLLIPPAAAGALSEYLRQQQFPRRFAEVEPGQLYRGGRPTAEDIRRLHRDKKLRTVLSLTGETRRGAEDDMVDVTRQLGIRHVRIPMPGNGVADSYEPLDQAVDILSAAENRPVFFHCAAGKQRTSAVLGAYRLKHDGRPLPIVLAELQREYGLDTRDERELVDYLRGYDRYLQSRETAHRQRSMTDGVPEPE
jgi:protein tyrosine/serine phosphatase